MQQGGIEVRLLDVMRRLRPNQFHVDVCALSGLHGSLDSEVQRLGGEVIRLPVKSLGFGRRFTRLLRENGYQVVHANVHHTSGMILGLARKAGVPVRIVNFHSVGDGRTSTWARRVQRRAMRHLIDRYSTDIVGCCETVLAESWGERWQSDSRCRAIYYGADGSAFEPRGNRLLVRDELGIPSEAPVFLHLGRSSPEKNHRRLLAIFARIRSLLPSAWLVLAGTGTADPEGEIAAAIRDLGLRDRTIALGARTDVPRLLEAADVLLLPSIFEGLPNAVLEACAAGVPVLATDLGGVREIASRLALVRYLPLSVSDDAWAAAASALPGEAQRVRLRETAAETFRASVFHLDRSTEAHCLLWSRAKGPAELACS
jgi:glycosyltransferase involved in cell wall biosynthesis